MDTLREGVLQVQDKEGRRQGAAATSQTASIGSPRAVAMTPSAAIKN
jgi:hypothetical protein